MQNCGRYVVKLDASYFIDWMAQSSSNFVDLSILEERNCSSIERLRRSEVVNNWKTVVIPQSSEICSSLLKLYFHLIRIIQFNPILQRGRKYTIWRGDLISPSSWSPKSLKKRNITIYVPEIFQLLWWNFEWSEEIDPMNNFSTARSC